MLHPQGVSTKPNYDVRTTEHHNGFAIYGPPGLGLLSNRLHNYWIRTVFFPLLKARGEKTQPSQ